jgi:hypothetical protein
MRIGSLVKSKTVFVQVGIVTSIGSPNPIVKVLWSNGKIGSIHAKWLEVVCK